MGCAAESGIEVDATPHCELAGPGAVVAAQLCNDGTLICQRRDEKDAVVPLVGCMAPHLPGGIETWSLCVERCAP